MVQRVRPPDDLEGLPARAGYVDAYAAPARIADGRSARAWADLILDDAGPTVLAVIRTVQRGAGLLLVTPEPPNLAVGWAVLHEEPDHVVLGVEGRVYTPRVVLAVRQESLLLVTAVEPRGLVGRLVWTLVAPLHRVTVRTLTAAAERVAAR
ncbi:DUF2867 domain-containing protein [Actinomycetospora termitidis]|uniref:DUF2867 domain-containing protein n=1 Tax=Actinomycetospora termitidis TaxID=3053470 RepID=A0ABT7MEP7_9PSEU|nr:DUF2867 domain-containing protein [Actinomycetospora sp. Odt1-22]MDL5159125.1 DUF2867 domain-containing protein [Actinomycetospora sp. Odt1-22]